MNEIRQNITSTVSLITPDGDGCKFPGFCDTLQVPAQPTVQRDCKRLRHFVDELTEAEIVRGLRLGDSCAWQALCDQYSRRVWAYVARLAGPDQSLVSDIFQETLLAVARSGRNLSDSSRLWPWLAAIAHNQVALHWRKHRRRRMEALTTEPVAADLSAERGLLLREEREQVRSVLLEMSADAAVLLEAKYIDELTVAEIVQTFGGTTESVRSRLARARREFEQRISVWQES